MILAVLLAPFLAATATPPDAHDIVRQSLAAWEAESHRLLSYLYIDRTVSKDLDGDDKVKSVASKTHEIRMIEGSPYRRLLERDGKPIPPDEQALQAAFLQDNIQSRQRETPEERAKRISEYEKRADRQRSAVREIPDAFDFQVAGEETVSGRKVWVIDAKPHRGYQPKSRYAQVYPELAGRLWIDQKTLHWVKISAELQETATVGWILIRIGKGGRAEMEQQLLADGAWAPKRFWYRVSVRIGLVKHIHEEQEDTFWGYQKIGVP